jgi:5-methylcytosine-specific restriction endonuclease McrA
MNSGTFMEYITSRRNYLPELPTELEDAYWFNLWQRKLWPYQELEVGSILYWYQTPSRSIVWKSVVTDVARFTYGSRSEAHKQLVSQFGNFDPSEDYFINAPEHGYGLAYKVSPLLRMEIPKPRNIQFPRVGWLRIAQEVEQRWLIEVVHDEDDMTLGEFVPEGRLLERLQKINSIMSGRSPRVVAAIVRKTIRRDTELVRTLKEVCDFRCQYPGCDAQIPRRQGGFYIEVAHVRPVSKGGQSVIGNLLVLCPNHHKEFDYGDLKIKEQMPSLISGSLNGREFKICLPN